MCVCVCVNRVCFFFQLVGQFIARAVKDKILSKSYLDGYKGKVDCVHARYVLVLLLNTKRLLPFLCGMIMEMLRGFTVYPYRHNKAR